MGSGNGNRYAARCQIGCKQKELLPTRAGDSWDGFSRSCAKTGRRQRRVSAIMAQEGFGRFKVDLPVIPLHRKAAISCSVWWFPNCKCEISARWTTGWWKWQVRLCPITSANYLPNTQTLLFARLSSIQFLAIKSDALLLTNRWSY